jgi:hypothetical protein
MPDPRTSLLPNTNQERTTADTQRTEFIKQSYEKEAESLGVHDTTGKGLTAYQKKLLDTIRNMDAVPPKVNPPGSTRTDEQIAASVSIHKRVNPGYVEMPYRSSTGLAFEYKPPPDFTKAFLKKDSDCKFQKYAAEAILKHVDLKKTSH